MARSSSRRSVAAWCAAGLLLWSCASKPGAIDGNGGGASGGDGGAPGATGGSPGGVGGAVGNEAGGGQSAGSAGTNGGTTDAGGSFPSELGGTPSSAGGGAGDSAAAGAAGAAEGGAGGSDDSLPSFDGHCGHGWADPESTSAPDLEGSVTPHVDSAGNWSFTFGRYRFVVAATRGARVIEFSIDGNNLIDATSGSTFWPSPQQAYPWPPPAELDSAAYTAAGDAKSLSLTSKTSKTLGLSVHKRFWVNERSGVVSIEYELINQSELSASWAPWEVTRVRAGGYTFAPQGPGNRTITQDFPLLTLSLLPPPPAANPIQWLNYPGISAKLTKSDYINEFDGAEGWLAHANRFGKGMLPVLFVKSFLDAPDESLPDNQAEIQLWTSGTANPKLIEVEEQGAAQLLEPGASLSWTVHWSACELPSSLVLSAGSAELAALARAHAIQL
jgi:hypothetical protein